MSAGLQIAIAIGSVLALMALMGVVRHLAGIWQVSAEVQRKLVHIGTGLYALTLPWLFADRWPVYLLVAVTLVVMLVLRLPNSRLGKTLHSVERRSYGDFFLAISVGLCLFLAEDQLFLYVLPIAVLTLADAAAALAGSTYGTRFFRVEEGEKSIEGSVVFFTVTLLISVVCLMLMTPFAAANILVLSLMVAAFGTLVEAASWQGFDNLFLPVGLLIFLAAHGSNPLPELLTLAALFVLSVVAFKTIAPKLGLTRHAARVYVVTVFLLLAVTAVQNTIFPILMLAAHAWSRSAAPCTSKYPDLDIVAGLALLSLGFLALGNSIGLSAISFYGIAAMGMVIGLCALALSPQTLVARLLSLFVIAVMMCALRAGVVALNPEAADWNGPMWAVVGMCLVLAAGIPAFAPRLFDQARVAKLLAMSLIIPLGYYLFSAHSAGALL